MIDTYIVSVDPSINTCGVAIFLSGQLVTGILVKPSKYTSNYVQRAKYITNSIKEICEDFEDFKLVIEIPEYFGVAGHIAVASGSIIKLSVVCGMICTLTDNLVAVNPSRWKGNMNKEVCHNRLIKIYPEQIKINTDNNIVDAIGIGDWYIKEGSKIEDKTNFITK